MFYHISTMTKMTMKLLFRNKGFLFFTVALPILATLILNINAIGEVVVEESAITELSGPDDQIAYLNDYERFPLKVYDSSGSKTAERFLERLGEQGIFQIYRVDASEMTEEEITGSAENTALKDKAGAIAVFAGNFEESLLDGDGGKAVILYETGEDERFELLSSAMETLLSEYSAIGLDAENAQELNETIDSMEENRYSLEIRQYADTKEGSINSLDVSYADTDTLGYTFAILSLSFLFSGVLILGTMLKEKQNLVYTRIMLTNAGAGSYMASKFAVIILSTLAQTFITGVALTVLVKQDLTISIWQLMFLVFLTGLIFNGLSVCVGIFCSSILPAAYVSFVIWVLTALLGGLYFDISHASETMQRVAMLMPQRWMLKGAQMMTEGNSAAYPTILAVTAGYLIVIVVTGVLGLKLNRKE